MPFFLYNIYLKSLKIKRLVSNLLEDTKSRYLRPVTAVRNLKHLRQQLNE